MHDRLLNASVYVSGNMFNMYCLKQGEKEIKVPTDKASIIVSTEDHSLRIVVPKDFIKRKSCFRSRLPQSLASVLGLYTTSDEKQIYRIINEVDMGTDQLMHEEDIPSVSWLEKVERVQPITQPTTTSSLDLPNLNNQPNRRDVSEEDFVSALGNLALTEERSAPNVQSQQQFVFTSRPSRHFISIPATLSSNTVPPQYHKVLQHIHRQAVGVQWRDRTQSPDLTITSELTAYFANLAVQGDPLEAFSRPELFGSDQYSHFRLGAAGELFVSERSTSKMLRMLRSCLGVRIFEEPSLHSTQVQFVKLAEQDPPFRSCLY